MLHYRVLGITVIACALWTGTVAADIFNWTGTNTALWSDSVSWVHVNDPSEVFSDNGLLPGTLDTAQIYINDTIYLDMHTAGVDVLNVSNHGEIRTGTWTLLVSAPGATAQTTITGTGAAGDNSQILVQGFPTNIRSFDTDNLTITNGGELDIRGGIAHIDNFMDMDASSYIKGTGTISFEDENDDNGIQLDMRGTIVVGNGTLILQAPNGGTLDLDGIAGGGGSVIDVDGPGFSRLLVDASLSDYFSGLMLIGADDRVWFTEAWTANTSAAGSEISMDPGSGNDSEIKGAPFTLTGANGKMNVKSGTGLITSSEFNVVGGATVTVSPGATLELNTLAFFASDSDLVFLGGTSGMTIEGDTTIEIAVFNWDGGGGAGNVTTIAASDSLTINVNEIDDVGEEFDGRILNSGTLDVSVNNGTEKWTMRGRMDLTGGTVQSADDDTMVVSGDLNALSGSNEVAANMDLESGSSVVVSGAGTNLELSGSNNFRDGATITVDDGVLTLSGNHVFIGIDSVAGTGELQLDGSMIVYDFTSIDVAVFDWDGTAGGGSFTSVSPGNTLTINAQIDDAVGGTSSDFGGRIDITEDAKVVVNDTNGWQMSNNGEMNFSGGAGTATLDGLWQFSSYGPITVNNGTALILCDFNAVGGTVTVKDGATLAFKGNGAGISASAVLSFVTGNTTLQIGGTVAEVAEMTVNQNTPFDWDGPSSAGNHQTNIGVESRLTITSAINDAYDGTINMDTDARLRVTSGPWTMAGDLNMAGGAGVYSSEVIITGNVTDTGGFDVPGFDCPVTFRSTAHVTIPAGHALVLNGATTFDGGFYGTTGTLVQQADATVISDTIIDCGRYDWDAGVNPLTLTIKSGAQLLVGGTHVPVYDDNIVIENDGFLAISGDSVTSWSLGSTGVMELRGLQVYSPTAQVGGNDRFINYGTVRGNGRFYTGVENHGLLDPGLSAGSMNIHNGLTLAADGTLKIELAGTAPYTGFDLVSSPAATSIDGTLDLHVIKPYVPPLGQQSQILATNGYTGTFAETNNVAYSNLLGLAVRYDFDPLSVYVRVSVRGDTDFDNDVDISDFNTLAGNFDPGGLNADNRWRKGNFDGDRDIDIGDFNVLAGNFLPSGYDSGAAADTQLAADPGQIDLVVDLATGKVALAGNAAAISGLQVFSTGNSLLTSDFTAEVLQFVISTNPSTYAEGAFVNIPVNGAISLGILYDLLVDSRDVSFEYTMIGQPTVRGNVIYIPEPGSLLMLGLAGMLVIRRRR